MRYRALLFIFLFSAGLTTTAQQRSIDSLKAIIGASSSDTSCLSALYDILNYLPASECEFYNDKMIRLSESMLKKESPHSAKFKRFAPFRAEGYYNKGVFLSNRNKGDSALIFYQKGLEAYKALGNEQMEAYCYMNMAIIYTTKASFSTAIDLLYKSLAINEKNKDLEGIGDTYMHIARVYYIQKMHAKAFTFMNKAYMTYEKAGYGAGILESLYKMAQIKTDMFQFREAMVFLNKSISLSRQLKIKDQNKQEQLLYTCKGYIAFQRGETDSVIFYIKKSIALAKESNNTYLLGTRYLLLSRAYYKQGNYAEALKYGNWGLAIAKETKNLDLQWNLTKLISNIYKATGNYRLALEMQDTFLKLHDSIKNEADKKHVIEQQLQYEFDKKALLEKSKHEKEIYTIVYEAEKSHYKKNIGIFILLFIFLSLGIIGYLIYKQQKQKTVIEKQNFNLLKQRMLLSQMNPHFIFNAINSIQSYILQKKEIDAYTYLAKFAKLIRMVLNNSAKNQILLYEEIDLLRTYIEIEQLRFENVFSFSVEIGEEVNEQEISIPPMLIQPLVENAIWHGIMNLEKEKKGHLLILFTKENNLLKIIIEDNGIGRQQAQALKNSHHRPVGMHLTEQRLSVLQELANKVQIKIHDLKHADGKPAGTRVEMYLPNRLSI